MRHVRPRVRHRRRQSRLNSVPAAGFHDGQHRERHEAQHDQEELQHLVVNRAGQAAQVGVGEHDRRREQDRVRETPAQHQFEQKPQRVHRNAGGEDGHHGEGERVEGARLLVEAELQIFGHGSRAAAVVKRHHEDAHEDHRRDRAHPIEMGGHDAILGARGDHADQFLRAQVGRDKGQAGDPDGQRTPGRQEFIGRGYFLLEQPSDTDNEDKVEDKDEVIDWGEYHAKPRT